MDIYENASLSPEERAKDLLARLTPEEKLAQLQCMMAVGDPALTLGSFEHGVGEISVFAPFGTAMDVAEANRRIIEYVMERGKGIPPIIHMEALSGVISPEATIFTSAIGIAATFDPEALHDAMDTVRRQMVASGYRRALSPVMDVARDPRWGRIGETYGEDPTLCARMSVAFTKGLQCDDHSDGVAATGKHFLGYGKSEGGLNIASNEIPPRELREVYAKPFQAAITDGDMLSIMNSYGNIDGDMVIGSRAIMTDLLRGEMKFRGAVVSDYKSVDKLIDLHVCSDPATAGIEALTAGLDVECPMPFGFTDALLSAIQEGRLSEEVLDGAVYRVLLTKFELGLFENPYPRVEELENAYHNPDNRQKSLEMARKSIVLLKNDGVLPLPKTGKKIALVGPHADHLRLMFGGYTYPASVEMRVARSMSEMAGMDGFNNPNLAKFRPKNDSFVQSNPFTGSEVLREHAAATAKIQELYGDITPTLAAAMRDASDCEIVYTKGCEVAGDDRSGFDEAVRSAREADYVVLAVGGKYGWGKHCTIGEGIDCDQIGLPGIQAELARMICETGKPCVVVHMDARPLSDVYLSEHASAILECWFPGMTGGTAIAEVLFGDCNPAGRLPVTIARNVGQIPIYNGQKPGNGYHSGMVLSRYCNSSLSPLFYFGHGLSYTKFAYDGLDISCDGKCAVIQCKVRNEGSVAGDEVVQLYVTDELASMVRPFKEFAGFKRVSLTPGEEKTIRFECAFNQFAFLDKQMHWTVEAGEMCVQIGGSSEDLPLKGSFTIPNTFEVAGHERKFYAEAREA